jgi:hypothetical protein
VHGSGVWRRSVIWAMDRRVILLGISVGHPLKAPGEHRRRVRWPHRRKSWGHWGFISWTVDRSYKICAILSISSVYVASLYIYKCQGMVRKRSADDKSGFVA